MGQENNQFITAHISGLIVGTREYSSRSNQNVWSQDISIWKVAIYCTAVKNALEVFLPKPRLSVLWMKSPFLDEPIWPLRGD